MSPSKFPYAGVFKLIHMTKHLKIMVLLTDWILNVPQGPCSKRLGGEPMVLLGDGGTFRR